LDGLHLGESKVGIQMIRDANSLLKTAARWLFTAHAVCAEHFLSSN
jgi:hypothetical protein